MEAVGSPVQDGVLVGAEEERQVSVAGRHPAVSADVRRRTGAKVYTAARDGKQASGLLIATPRRW